MATTARGYFELELGGKKRPCKSGTNATAIFCELRKIDISQIGELLAPEKVQKQEITGSEIRDLIYSLLVAGARYKKQPIDFDTYEVGDWLDEASEEVILQAFQEIADNAAQGGGQSQKKQAGRKSNRKRTK